MGLSDERKANSAKGGRKGGPAAAEARIAASLPSLQALQARALSRTVAPEVSQNGLPVDFERATFACVVKEAKIVNGGWRVLMEVPHGEADAFYPVRKAFQRLLFVTFERKDTPEEERKIGPGTPLGPKRKAAKAG